MNGPPQHVAWEPPSIPDFLRPLRSVLLAVVDPDGALIDANRGFRALLPEDKDAPAPADVRAVFINPTFEQLLAGAPSDGNGVACAGLMTLGAIDAESDSWLGNVRWREGRLLVVCERDVEQDHQLRQQLLQLTDEYAEQQRDLARAHRQLTAYADQLERLSLTDSLTNLPNRRHFDTIMEHELENAVRAREPLAVLLVDLDHFKAINDAWGHPEGDRLLQAVAGSLTTTGRKADLVARWGGEEFVVLAPKTDTAGARELGERLRRAVATLEPPGGLPAMTGSIGAAVLHTGESAEELIGRADTALYQAKENGRNCVCIAAAPID